MKKTLPYTKFGHRKELNFRNSLDYQVKEKLIYIINYEKLEKNEPSINSLNQIALNISMDELIKQNNELMSLTVEKLQNRVDQLIDKKLNFFTKEKQSYQMQESKDNIFNVKKNLKISL